MSKNPLSISPVLFYNKRVRKILGIALVLAGILILVIIAFAPSFGLVSAKPDQLSNAGAMLGTVMFGIVPSVVLVGIGVYLIALKDTRR